jgi:hypothetical protein
VFLASQRHLPPLLVAVAHVVRVGTEEKMRRANACRVVASVANELSVGYWTNEKRPGRPVRLGLKSGPGRIRVPKPSVAPFAKSRCPRPAIAEMRRVPRRRPEFVHLCPEPTEDPVRIRSDLGLMRPPAFRGAVLFLRYLGTVQKNCRAVPASGYRFIAHSDQTSGELGPGRTSDTGPLFPGLAYQHTGDAQ